MYTTAIVVICRNRCTKKLLNTVSYIFASSADFVQRSISRALSGGDLLASGNQF